MEPKLGSVATRFLLVNECYFDHRRLPGGCAPVYDSLQREPALLGEPFSGEIIQYLLGAGEDSRGFDL